MSARNIFQRWRSKIGGGGKEAGDDCLKDINSLFVGGVAVELKGEDGYGQLEFP